MKRMSLHANQQMEKNEMIIVDVQKKVKEMGDMVSQFSKMGETLNDTVATLLSDFNELKTWVNSSLLVPNLIGHDKKQNTYTSLS